jgi:hypothetical protein
MIKNARLVRKFERELIRTEKPNLRRGLKIAEALREEAVSLRPSRAADPLAGIEIKIRIAKAINYVRTTPCPDRRRSV